MRFWDSSALLALIAGQSGSDGIKSAIAEDSEVVVWWGTPVELASGACRLRRNDVVDDNTLAKLLAAIQRICSDADQIEPAEQVRNAAMRILRVHNLRAADSLQLAAALVWTDHNPAGAPFVCLDNRLRAAAEKEGFRVLPE